MKVGKESCWERLIVGEGYEKARWREKKEGGNTEKRMFIISMKYIKTIKKKVLINRRITFS